MPCCSGLVAAPGCGATDPTQPAEGDDDAAFATELMYRDAALLNLLDVALGRELSPAVADAGEQLRIETSERMSTAAELLEEWGEKVPVTSRDHGAEHSSDNDVPELEGMPTGRDLQRLGKLDGEAFEAAYVDLLTARWRRAATSPTPTTGREPRRTSWPDAAVASARRTRRALTPPRGWSGRSRPGVTSRYRPPRCLTQRPLPSVERRTS